MKTKNFEIKVTLFLLGTAVAILSLISCKKTTTPPQLTLPNLTDTIPAEGGMVSQTFSSNASWSLDTLGIGWLHVNKTSGNSGDVTIEMSAPENRTGVSRSIILEVKSTNGQNRRVTIYQAPVIYPSYNTSPLPPDATGMGSTAIQIGANIKLGMNIWNTMEAPGDETGWGNPVITQAFIDSIKQNGFNAIRIPCQWDYSHIINRATEEIDPAWLNRVKEVIQYCYNSNLYVVLNIHWDGGWLDCRATGAKKDTVVAKQKALWEQIATKFRDFDEHLLFASANEPDAVNMKETVNLMGYHQTFIDAVRSTGGKNAYRVLIIQAPSTSIDLANQFLNPDNVYTTPSFPVDHIPNRMMLEFHSYGPPNFCLLDEDASWGPAWYFWGANYHTSNPLFLNRNSTPQTEERYVDSIFKTAKTNFVDKGIPLLMGEYGALINHSTSKLAGYPADSVLSLNSRAYYHKYITKTARANGIMPFLWSGVFNRQTNAVADRQTLDSLLSGAGL